MSHFHLYLYMRMIDCPNCEMNVIEVDDTPNIDGTTSFVRCKVCKFNITLYKS